jgi:hypothetical protein
MIQLFSIYVQSAPVLPLDMFGSRTNEWWNLFAYYWDEEYYSVSTLNETSL